MSHFTVMVATPTSSEVQLEEALQPYHEYECTGTKDQYVIFVSHHEEIVQSWENQTENRFRAPDGTLLNGWEDIFYRDAETDEERDAIKGAMGSGISHGVQFATRNWEDGSGYRAKVHYTPEGYEKVSIPVKEIFSSIEEYAEEEGYEKHEEQFGRFTNPDAQWDWWVVGGRWSGYLLNKEGKEVDSAYKRDIDFEAMVNREKGLAAARWDKFHSILHETNDGVFIPFNEVYEDFVTNGGKTVEEARKHYHAQAAVPRINEEFGPFFEPGPLMKDRAEYIEREGRSAYATFALVHDNQWHERGDMGYWGIVIDEKDQDDWYTEFQRILDTIPDDYYIWIVDCHI